MNEIKRPDVLAVVTNHKRPSQAAVVVRVLSEQDCEVVVVSNATVKMNTQGAVAGWPSHDEWAWARNSGPPCRFAPAWMHSHLYKHVLFVDEDLLPTDDCVANCVRAAGLLGDRFATIGCVGRNFRLGRRPRYVRRNVRAEDRIEQTDMTCRLHFVRADMCHLVLSMKHALLARGATEQQLWHDDMLLCLGVQLYTGWPSYVLPRPALRRKDLSDGGAGFSANPSHVEDRSNLIRMAIEAGWERPVAGKEILWTPN